MKTIPVEEIDQDSNEPVLKNHGVDSPCSTRNRIMLAAGPIFADKGFDAATVREICQAAEVNVASVKYHFGGKQNLYHETVIYAHSCRASMFEGRADSNIDPAERLREYIQQILFSMVVNEQGPWQVRLLMNEIQQPTDSCRQLVRDEFRPFVLGLMETIAQLSGKSISTELQSTLAMSVIGQCMIYRFAPETHALMVSSDKHQNLLKANPPEDLSTLADIVWKFSIAGIDAVAREANE